MGGPERAVAGFFATHARLTVSGQTHTEAGLQLAYSPWVAASSLLYLPAAFVFARGCRLGRCGWCWGLLLAAQSAVSVMGDAVALDRFWVTADRIVASVLAVSVPAWFLGVRRRFTLGQSLVLLAGVAASLACLAWARASASQGEYVLRQSLWHVASGGLAAWFAAVAVRGAPEAK